MIDKLRESIIVYRGQNNLTQTEFAKLCNVGLDTINQIENDRQKPQAKTIAKILNILNRA